MPQKLTDIETEMLHTLKLLGGYSLSDLQELADEAFRDLMQKPPRAICVLEFPTKNGRCAEANGQTDALSPDVGRPLNASSRSG